MAGMIKKNAAPDNMQPLGPFELDFNNPLIATAPTGVVFFDFNDTRLQSYPPLDSHTNVQMHNGFSYDKASTAFDVAPAPTGVCMKHSSGFNNATSWGWYPTNVVHRMHSWAALIYVNSIESAASTGCLWYGDGSILDDQMVEWGIDGTTYYLKFAYRYGGGIQGWYTGTTAVPTGAWVMIGGTWVPASTSGRVYFYLNGQPAGDVETGAESTIPNPANQTLGMGMFHQFNNTWIDGKTAAIIISSSKWTDAMHAQLYRDGIYSLVKPRVKYVSTGAGATPATGGVAHLFRRVIGWRR